MSSRLLSQIFNQNSASIYETLHEHDAATETDSDIDDLEERAGMQPHRRQERSDRSSIEESTFELQQQPPFAESSVLEEPEHQQRFFSAFSRPRSNRYSTAGYRDEDDNTDVPQSLLFEAGQSPENVSRRKIFHDVEDSTMGPGASITGGPGLSTTRNRRLEEQWNAARAHEYPQGTDSSRRPAQLRAIDPKERAMWKWANVENLDNFLQDVGTSVAI
jgi:autophagy-related protein 9